MRVGDDPRTTTDGEACGHYVIVTTTGCCASCGALVQEAEPAAEDPRPPLTAEKVAKLGLDLLHERDVEIRQLREERDLWRIRAEMARAQGGVQRLGGERGGGMTHNGMVEALAEPEPDKNGLIRDEAGQIIGVSCAEPYEHLLRIAEMGGSLVCGCLRLAETADEMLEGGRNAIGFRGWSALPGCKVCGGEGLVTPGEPDWEGKGEPQGERGRVGRLLGIRRDESIVEAARRARERIDALEDELHLTRGVGEEWKRARLVFEAQAYRRALLVANARRRVAEDAIEAACVALEEPEPGQRVALVGCPSCGARLEVVHGDEPDTFAAYSGVDEEGFCAQCGDHHRNAEGRCATCSFDEGATDDVGPGERLLLREVLGAEEGETLVEAAHRVVNHGRLKADELDWAREEIDRHERRILEHPKPGRLTTFLGDVLGAAYKASRG